MHPEPKFPFQHRQRLATPDGLQLLRVALENDSRIDTPCQCHQPKHGLVIEKRRFVHINVSSPQEFPELRVETRFIQEPRDRICVTKRLRHIRPSRFLDRKSTRLNSS